MEDAVILAYIAGIIDGEGSICISRSSHESFMKQYNRNYPYYVLTVRVGMIDPVAIDLIHDTFGIGSRSIEKKYHKQRPMYRWRVYKRPDCKYVIDKLMPYLRVKKPQALLALDFIKNFKRSHRFNPMSDEKEKERFGYWVKMRTLNGIASPATTERAGISGRSKSVRID